MCGKLVLQILEVLTGLEVRIGLGNDHQPAEQARHLGIGLRGCLHARRLGCVRTAGGYLVEDLAFVGRIALHGLDEVRDEIRAPPELHGDSAEPFSHQRAEPDQPVVDADHVQKQQYDDRQEDPARNAHVITP